MSCTSLHLGLANLPDRSGDKLLHRLLQNCKPCSNFPRNCSSNQGLGLSCAADLNVLQTSSHWQIASGTIYAAEI